MKQERRRREDFLHFKGYASEIGGKLTFIGVMQKYLNDVNERWAESTRKAYYGHYEDWLFPILPEIALEEMTEADFEHIIDTLIERGRINNKFYSEKDIQHYRHLLRVVTKTAEKNGVCPDILWGSLFQENDSPAHKASIKVKPRSLSTGEEYLVTDRVLTDPKEDGELIGIGIMFGLGPRNQDACGLNWECFDYVDGEDMGFLRFVGSTEQKSNKLKPGGKTLNAPRILPVTGLLLKRLAERRTWIRGMIAAGELTDDETGEKIDTMGLLPIVCRGQRLSVRCSADDLTRAAKTLFREIHLDEGVLEELSELMRQRFANEDGERDVTAYLFRRNFATHMTILGLDDDTIHYLMGHEFSDEEVTKARYTNRDTLRQIGEQMRRRAVINPDFDQDEERIIFGDQTVSNRTQGHTVLTVDPNGKKTTVVAYFKPLGASKLKVKLKYEKAPETGEIILSPEQYHTVTEVGEEATYRKIYSRRKDPKETIDEENGLRPPSE